MEWSKVQMLFLSAVCQDDLPAHLQQLPDQDDFWLQLEDTPEDQLTPLQIEMIQALGAEVPPQRRSSPADGKRLTGSISPPYPYTDWNEYCRAKLARILQPDEPKVRSRR
ncbi:MAG: hypothetical protein JSS45_07920 [Proteobacteria bacterium]|nr:hypothetical protein [Pseudomonadota bacterium]